MLESTEQIFDRAPSLSQEDRARLAEQLLRSLDDKSRSEVDAAWADELAERIRQIEAEEVQLIPGDESVARVRARLEQVQSGRPQSPRP